MKKVLFKTLILVLILNIVLAGCSQDEIVSAVENEIKEIEDMAEEASAAEVPEEEKVYDNSLIGSFIDAEGTYKDGDKEISYHFSLPQIIDDSEDAKKVNEKIKNGLLRTANEAIAQIKSGNVPALNNITYSVSWLDEMASIVIYEDMPFENVEKYICNYDFKDKKIVANKELLSYLGIEEDKFLHKIREIALDIFDSNFEGIEYRAAVISKGSLNIHNIEIYIEDGLLSAKFPMYNTFGNRMYYAYVPVDLTKTDLPAEEASLEFVNARLEDNNVTVKFTEDENSSSYLSPAIQYEKEYDIHGLYKIYTDVFLGNLGNDINPKLFLLAEDGTVSYCDIASCAAVGDYFTASDNLGNLTNITDFKAISDRSGNTTAAIDAEGNEIDLYDAVSERNGFTVDEMKDNSVWETDDKAFSFSFDISDEGTFLTFENLKDGFTYEGSFTYAGLTEDGYIFPVTLKDDEGNFAGGFLTAAFNMGEDIYEENDITLTLIHDEELPGCPQLNKPLVFNIYSEMDGTDIGRITSSQMCGKWMSTDKSASVTLEDGKYAAYETYNPDGTVLSLYDGIWKIDPEKEILYLSLDYFDGEQIKRGSKNADYLEGSYSFLIGMDGSLILTPDEGAFSLLDSQKMKNHFPEAFYRDDKGKTPFIFTENDENIKKACIEYAKSTGIKANSADLICYVDTGILVRVYLDDDMGERTRAWCVVNEETMKGINYLNKKTVDFDSYI